MLYAEKERQHYSGFVISKHSYKLERVGASYSLKASFLFVCSFVYAKSNKVVVELNAESRL